MPHKRRPITHRRSVPAPPAKSTTAENRDFCIDIPPPERPVGQRKIVSYESSAKFDGCRADSSKLERPKRPDSAIAPVSHAGDCLLGQSLLYTSSSQDISEEQSPSRDEVEYRLPAHRFRFRHLKNQRRSGRRSLKWSTPSPGQPAPCRKSSLTQLNERLRLEALRSAELCVCVFPRTLKLLPGPRPVSSPLASGLPGHVLLNIFSNLSQPELSSAAAVCRRWHDFARHRTFWRAIRLDGTSAESACNLLSVTPGVRELRLWYLPYVEIVLGRLAKSCKKVTHLEVVRCNANCNGALDPLVGVERSPGLAMERVLKSCADLTHLVVVNTPILGSRTFAELGARAARMQDVVLSASQANVDTFCSELGSYVRVTKFENRLVHYLLAKCHKELVILRWHKRESSAFLDYFAVHVTLDVLRTS